MKSRLKKKKLEQIRRRQQSNSSREEVGAASLKDEHDEFLLDHVRNQCRNFCLLENGDIFLIWLPNLTNNAKRFMARLQWLTVHYWLLYN